MLAGPVEVRVVNSCSRESEVHRIEGVSPGLEYTFPSGFSPKWFFSGVFRIPALHQIGTARMQLIRNKSNGLHGTSTPVTSVSCSVL